MSYTYDEQLIDAVAVRRQRLTAALMFGPDRLRREWHDRIRPFIGGALLAAVIAAGCVATSFVQQLFAENPPGGVPTAPVTPSPQSLPTPAGGAADQDAGAAA
ncbi:hypothetical protein [Nocardioides sp. CFH 31398]|uniref:hypothetical protein n=1 Tax=Nocardioides sp. CFH 31398 TaxID=2919579 RepID=UPI001F069F6D|nr:hypothetical protein [Nocardioides sp. CFH 31398]MCH1868176.1 hypothetical protein [Nocardioides sp. CFH 31398]